MIEIENDSAAGHEQRGRRPVLVISINELYSALGLAVACPMTTQGGRAVKALLGI